MKLKQSIRYQLADYKAATLVFYGAVVVFLGVMGGLLTAFSGEGTNLQMSGITAISALFLFIGGLCSYHDNLPMHLQNGVSRKTMFQARLVVTAATCAVCSAVDHLLALLINLLARPFFSGWSDTLFEELYGKQYPSLGPVEGAALSLAFSFVMLLLASSLGYFLIVFFYRMPLKLRVTVAVALGLLLLPGQVLVKAADALLLGNALARFAEAVVYPVTAAIEGSPFLTMGCWLLAAAAFSALSWLFMRRAVVRR